MPVRYREQAHSHRETRRPEASGRLEGRLVVVDLDFDLLAPSVGRAQVLRSGQPGKDAGLAAHGHGWPIAVGPRSRTGARECRAQARHRTKGARAFGYLGLFQVTRCKSETNRSRNRRNGYVHLQKSHRQSDRHREQARLPQFDPGASGKYSSAVRPSSPASQLPQFDPGTSEESGRLSGRHRRQASSHSLIRGYLKETRQPENSGSLGNMESPTWVMGWHQKRVAPDKPTDKSHDHGHR